VVNALYDISPRTYYTRAEAGLISSQFSNEVTLPNRRGHGTIKTITLEPSRIGRYVNGGGSTSYSNSYPNPNIPTDIFTGWNVEADPSEFWLQQGFFRYDLSDLMGKYIHSAKMDITANKTYSWICKEPDFTFPVSLDTEGCGIPAPASGCSQMLLVLTENATNGYHTTPPQATGDNYLWTESATTKKDVTDEVRMWVDGSQPNYGFLLNSQRTFTVSGDWTSYGCYTYYQRPALTIEYSDK